MDAHQWLFSVTDFESLDGVFQLCAVAFVFNQCTYINVTQQCWRVISTLSRVQSTYDVAISGLH
jgi:hypothetical protein